MFVVCHSLFICRSAAAATFLYPKMSGARYKNSNDCMNDFHYDHHCATQQRKAKALTGGSGPH